MNPRLTRWMCLCLVACADVRDVQGPRTFEVVDAPAGVSVFYDRDVQSVFDRSCTGGCHEPGGSGVAESGLDLSAGISYAELRDPTRSKNGPHVVPGDPENSLLMWKVKGTDNQGRDVYGDVMPLGRPALSEAEILTLSIWISEGALQSVAPPRPPRVVAAVVPDGTTIEITFDKALDPVSATEASHFTVTDADDKVVSVVSTSLTGADVVKLTLDQTLPAGVDVTVSVVGLRDDDGRAIVDAEEVTLRHTPVISFSGQIQPVFDQSCAFVGCHASDERFPPGAALVLEPGRAHGQLVEVASTQVEQRRVAAGNPDVSYLIVKLAGPVSTGDRMPVGGPFLSDGEVQLFRLWIEQGALDN